MLVLLAVLGSQLLAACHHTKPGVERAKGCILIQQIVPGIVNVDDSGNTTEPVRITIEARGEPEDLKGGEVVYMEEGVAIKTDAVGDLRAGVQTVTLGPGAHVTSSSEAFDYILLKIDGTEALSLSSFLNSEGAEAPPKKAVSASTASHKGADSDQPIATIEAGVDPEEADSIRMFSTEEVGITSVDEFVRETSGDETKRPPQIITIRGVNFKEGMLVRFRTTKGGQRVEARSPLTHVRTLATLEKPPGYVPNNPAALMTGVVIVPPKITHKVRSEYAVRTSRAQSSDSCQP